MRCSLLLLSALVACGDEGVAIGAIDAGMTDAEMTDDGVTDAGTPVLAPPARALFVEEVPAAARVELQLDAEASVALRPPAGATLRLAGTPQPPSPARTLLPAGTHAIDVVGPGTGHLRLDARPSSLEAAALADCDGALVVAVTESLSYTLRLGDGVPCALTLEVDASVELTIERGPAARIEVAARLDGEAIPIGGAVPLVPGTAALVLEIDDRLGAQNVPVTFTVTAR